MFHSKLSHAWQQQQSMVCVGLDPDLHKLPAPMQSQTRPYFEFCRAIVDATAPFCSVFKPQFAHFAARAKEAELQQLIHYIKSNYPDHVVILDAKRGDIGSTAAFYAMEAFERYQADAVTLNPYLGAEALAPFLDYADRGIVVLCRTSNSSSDVVQNYGSPPVYAKVASLVAGLNEAGQCMLVTGATHPEELAAIRALVGDMPLLVPGIGAQGGDLAAVMHNGLNSLQQGLVISSSRGIIYASNGADFAEKAAEAAQELSNQISRLIP